MSSCGQVVVQCEVEIDSAALPQQSSVRLVDGPLSVAPSEVIGVQLAAHRTRLTRRAKTVSSKMLHAYFHLPRRTGRHWRLQITNRRHQPHSFALPTPGTPAAAL